MVFHERTNTVIKINLINTKNVKDIDANLTDKITLPVPVCGNRDILINLSKLKAQQQDQ
jgi:hypothetical protein